MRTYSTSTLRAVTSAAGSPFEVGPQDFCHEGARGGIDGVRQLPGSAAKSRAARVSVRGSHGERRILPGGLSDLGHGLLDTVDGGLGSPAKGALAEARGELPLN